MLSYFGNLVDFCLILNFFKFLFYSPWLLRKNFQNEKGEIEFFVFLIDLDFVLCLLELMNC